jgi:hypothetical protein
MKYIFFTENSENGYQPLNAPQQPLLIIGKTPRYVDIIFFSGYSQKRGVCGVQMW